MSKHLFLTKLRPPRIAPDDLLRWRLLDRIERGANRDLTLVVTPPGYGKSTLLSRWRTVTERAVGWLSLDPADNDFLVFMEYLVAAIQSIDSCICQETASMLDARSPVPTQQLIQSLLAEIAESTRPFVLILDDYHEISSPEIHSAVLQIVRRKPTEMSVVITSRNEPNFPTLQMSARGELIELGPEDLRFTESETVEFLLEREQLGLAASEAAAISRWAEGWPVALRLVSRVLRGRSQSQIGTLLEALSDNVPSIRDFLWDEVLATRPHEQRSFLLQTSILERFTPELAAAVTGNPTSESLLSGLSRDNLFISRLSGPGTWYRYHSLFAEVLHRRLLEDASDSTLRDLHRRATDWFEEKGQINEVATHAVLARDWERAARYLVRICQDFYDQERIGSLRTWLGDLPEEIFAIEPRLANWLAWALMRSGHVKDAARPIELASGALSLRGNGNPSATALQFQVLKGIFEWDATNGQASARELLSILSPEEVAERVRAYIMLTVLQEMDGRLTDAAASLEEARVLNEQIGVRGLRVLELSVTAGLLQMMGKLNESANLFRRVIAIGDEWNDLPVQNAHHHLGSIYLEWNRLDDARAQALAMFEISKKTDTPIHLPSAHALLSRIAGIEGQWDVALEEIERSISLCVANKTFGLLRQFEETRCRIWLATDQISLAQSWARHIDPAVLTSMRFEDLPTILTWIRVRIYEGCSPEIVDRLEHLGDMARRHDWNLELITIQMLRAIVEHERGDLDAARIAIDDALNAGTSEGFLRSYLDEGPRGIAVLRLAAREGGPRRNHAVAVLSAAGDIGQPVPVERAGTHALLTARELEVMRLVADGLSNRAIGDTLFITEETVKTHLRHIFEKLAVSSRVQAVRKLHQFELL